MKGVNISHDMEVDILNSVFVKDAMGEHVTTVSEDTTLRELVHLIHTTEYTGFPVYNSEEKLVGMITRHDILNAVLSNTPDQKVKDIKSKDLLLVTPNDTLDDTISKMVEKDVSHALVVDPANPAALVGFLTKGDIMRAYHKKRMAEARQVNLNLRNILSKNRKDE